MQSPLLLFESLDLETATQQDVLDTFEAAMSNPLDLMYIMIVFDDTVSESKISPKFARTTIMTGGPIEMDGVRYNSMSEEDDPQ